MTAPQVIDLDRHLYGAPDAPVTVVEYGDFECPYCGASAPVLREVIDGSEGQVRLVFRHFPVFTKHPFALTAALAAEAAGEQFWPMHDQLFAHQPNFSDAELERYATEVGAPGPVTGEAVQAFRPAVVTDYRSGGELGVRGTPTLFIDGSLYTGRVAVGALRSELGLGR
jgi:protein-disulfide isomerase